MGNDFNRVIIDDLLFVCEVPRELGRILHLELRGDRVIAHTASGIQFIVPKRRPEPSHLDGPVAWDL